MHGPASADRERKLAAGNNKLTYGCIQLPGGKMRCFDEKGDLIEGDSVYVEPTVPGNYLYANDGHLKTHFENTPTRATGTVWGKNYDIDNIYYNTGY